MTYPSEYSTWCAERERRARIDRRRLEGGGTNWWLIGAIASVPVMWALIAWAVTR